MRKTKRFDPALIRRWLASARGIGRDNDYEPWHQVTRSDPSSRGRSHLTILPGAHRYTHTLSDNEQHSLLFILMLPNVRDILEQLPLAREEAVHELSRYVASYCASRFPGTLQIAGELGIKHPTVRKGSDREAWVSTTDFFILFEVDGRHSVLCVADKLAGDMRNKRTMQLMKLEREYWQRRNVDWLLLTPELYDRRVALTLSRTAAWALDANRSSQNDRRNCSQIAKSMQGYPLQMLWAELHLELGLDLEHAQRAFWQSVWRGETPLDLRRGWRASEPITILSAHEFLDLNPLAARRTAWMS